MSSFIHGWRAFGFARCSRTNEIVLQGQSLMHLHNPVQKAAECKGISGAMWMTDTAKDRLAKRLEGGKSVPHEGPAPDFDCTCGSYFYRTIEDTPQNPTSVYAHVTCLERTILHTSGGRTTQYSVDYLLAPSKPIMKVYVQPKSSAQPQNPVVPVVVTSNWGYPHMFAVGEEHNFAEVLKEVASSLKVPILEKEDMKGCPECLLANGWRKESEISDQHRRDWFGEGYIQQERDEGWEED